MQEKSKFRLRCLLRVKGKNPSPDLSPGVNNNGHESLTMNIYEKVYKKCKMAVTQQWGLWEKLIHEKTRSRKACVRVSWGFFKPLNNTL